jgi:aldose 1-epimerase
MSFSVLIDDKEIFPVIHLEDQKTKTKAVVYSYGALLNAFIVHGKHNMIDAFDSCAHAKENITNGFKSCKLSPFVCRIPEGKYLFNQQAYKTAKFFLGEEAIHGLIYDAPFEIVDSGADDEQAFVSLRYEYAKKDEGFPFPYLCTVTYKLEKANKISTITEIKNDSDQEMPLSDGWHPYFTLGSAVNDLQFKINASQMLEFDDHLVPTGKILPFNKFQDLEKFGETFLDNCFVVNNHHEPACILKSDRGLQLTMWPDKSYPYLQIYTPDHRRSIAIENLSSAPNAFNNGMGLIILKPGESREFTTVYQAEALG